MFIYQYIIYFFKLISIFAISMFHFWKKGRASCLLSSGKGNHMLAVIIQITGNPLRCYITSPVYAYVLRAIKRYVHRSSCTSFLLSSFKICGNPGISSLAGDIRYETVTGKCEL